MRHTKAKKGISKNKFFSNKLLLLAILLVAGSLLLSAISFFRINELQKSIERESIISFMNTVYDDYRSLNVDASAKAAYIPELNLKVAYDNQTTSQIRYHVDVLDEEGRKGDIYFSTQSELRKSANTVGEVPNSSCINAFYLTLSNQNETDNDMRLVYNKTLGDGRLATLYADKDERCLAYQNSDESKNILELLESIESY